MRPDLPEWGALTSEIYIILLDRLPAADEVQTQEPCVSEIWADDTVCLGLIERIAASEEFRDLMKGTADKARRLEMFTAPPLSPHSR